MRPFIFIDKRGIDPPNTVLWEKKYVFIDEILAWVESNDDLQLFAKIAKNFDTEHEIANMWNLRKFDSAKPKLSDMLKLERWTSEVPESLMKLLGALIEALSTNRFDQDARALLDIYSDYCNSKSEIHVNAAKLIFDDICKKVDPELRTRMFNIMLDDLFNSKDSDYYPLRDFDWDTKTIKQLTSRLIKLWQEPADFNKKCSMILAFQEILDKPHWALVEDVQPIIEALFPFFCSSDNVDTTEVGNQMRDVWWHVFKVYIFLGKAQFNKVTKILVNIIDRHVNDENPEGALSAMESLMELNISCDDEFEGETEFLEKHASMIVKLLHSDNFHIRNICHELIPMFSEYIHDEDVLSHIWWTLASRYRSFLAMKALKQINTSWGKQFNTKENKQKMLENCFHFERDVEQIPTPQTHWERYAWFNLNFHQLTTGANRKFVIEQSQIALTKLVQIPLPSTTILPLSWLCIRQVIKHKLLVTVPELQEKVSSYLEHEGQRRLYTTMNIFAILGDLSRTTKDQVLSLLNSMYTFVIDFPETPYSLDLEMGDGGSAMKMLGNCFAEIPKLLHLASNAQIAHCWNVSNDRIGYQLFYLSAHTQDIKLKTIHKLFESKDLRLKHIPVLVVTMCKYVKKSTLEKNLKFFISVFGKVCNVDLKEVISYQLPEGVYIGMPFAEQYYGSVFIGLEAVFSTECGEPILSLVPSIFGKNGVVEKVKAAYFTYPMQKKLARLLNAYIHCVGKEQAMPIVQHLVDELKQSPELEQILNKPKFEWNPPPPQQDTDEGMNPVMIDPFSMFMNQQ